MSDPTASVGYEPGLLSPWKRVRVQSHVGRFARTGAGRLALATILLIAPGCSSNLLKQSAPAKDYFAIEPGAPDAHAGELAVNSSTTDPAVAGRLLQVRPVRVTAPYDGVAFVYRTGPAHYESDYYNQFIAAPSALLTGALTDWLTKAGPLKVVGSSVAIHSDLVLDSEVTKLLVDFSDKANPRAVIAARFFLTRTSLQNGETFVLADAGYEQSVPVPSNNPAGYAQAWGTAYRQILQSMTTDLRPALQHAAP